jgi:adenylate kinase family enzyme
MSRVVIVGIAGGGKSTLARRISEALGLPLYQMDKIGWLPGWKLAGNDRVDRQHEQILLKDRWVIDGYGSWKSIERRCDDADTLILIDQPAWRHYWWSYKRNIKLLFRHNPDLPEGCSKWPLWKMMFCVVRQTRRDALPRLRKLLADRPQKTQFVIRSPREIESFCRQHLGDSAGV